MTGPQGLWFYLVLLSLGIRGLAFWIVIGLVYSLRVCLEAQRRLATHPFIVHYDSLLSPSLGRDHVYSSNFSWDRVGLK